MKNQFIASALLLLASASLAAQTPVSHSVFQKQATLQVTGKAVARVNGTELTDRDLLREMYAIFPYARQHNGAFPEAMEADIRKGALKMIEFEELVYQEAVRRKMTILPERLNKAEQDFRRQFHTPEQYQTFVKTECQGQSKVLRARIRRSLLIEDLLRAEVDNKSTVTPAAAKAYYQKNIEIFRVPESFAIQTISVMPPSKATAEQLKEARKRADIALHEAKATKTYEDFGLLAERMSEDDFRVVMGDHKLLDRAKLPPQIISAVEKMQPGQVSDLIQIDQVYTIVRLNTHVPAGIRNYADIKDGLQQYLRRQNVERLRSGLNASLRKNAKVEEL